MQPNTSQNMSLKAWHTLEAKTNKRIVTFYGTSGHGKGLVDAMSSLELKRPSVVLF